MAVCTVKIPPVILGNKPSESHLNENTFLAYFASFFYFTNLFLSNHNTPGRLGLKAVM